LESNSTFPALLGIIKRKKNAKEEEGRLEIKRKVRG
jgi:hypothetical protein